jgi:hypothetical protein
MTLPLMVLDEPVTGPIGVPPLIARRFGKLPKQCMWFAQCGNPAQVEIPHAMIGNVPTCLECARKVAEILAVEFDPPVEAAQWTDGEAWTFPSKPESTADFHYKWRRNEASDDYTLRWYDDATRSWETIRPPSGRTFWTLDEINAKVYKK